MEEPHLRKNMRQAGVGLLAAAVLAGSAQAATITSSTEQITLDADQETFTLVVSMEESDPYSIWKIVLVKPFRINKHTIEVTFKVDNLFNFREASFVDPGRQFLIGIRYAFK